MAALIVFGILSSAMAQQLNPPVIASPLLPAIPAAVFNVTNYGAIGDAISTNSAAINAAIMDACVTNSGGTVEIPNVPGSPNIYLSGPIGLRSFLNLQVDAGVTLRMLPYGSYSGGDFIADTTGSHAYHDIEISGTGTIDGQATLTGWWSVSGTSGKPYLMNFYHGAQILIKDITVTRAPIMHIKINGSSCTNVTIQNITISTDSSDSHNTDGIDVAGNNILIKDSSISCGDDNIAASANCANIVITNCAFGTGHGMSIGGSTSPGGVSNMLVINCTFNGTDNGIRIKSDNAANGNVGGGPCQNLQYINLGMTNVNNTAIMIYSYYNEVGTPTSITPATAAGEPVSALDSTPSYRNIIFSNLNATVAGSGIAGIIWGRTELPATNIIMSRVNIRAAKSFDIYNAYRIQFADSKITTTTSGQQTFVLWNAGLVVTNSLPGTNSVTIGGATSTNQNLELDNVFATMTTTSALAANPISLNGGTITNIGGLTLANSVVQNFVLGTNSSKIVVSGNLTLNSTINASSGAGFAATNYTLFTYAGVLAGIPVLGGTPAGFNCSLDTNTTGQVNLVVKTLNSPPAANPAIYYRNAGFPLTIAIVNLATNWSDPDGNPISLTGVNNSTNGATVNSDGTNIYYIHTNNVTDQFTYAISDGQGGAATGVVNVLIVPASTNFTISGTIANGDGSVTLNFAGVPGYTYWLEAATNLTPPVDWMTIATNTADTNGFWQVTDTSVTNNSSRFYRSVQP